MNRSFRPKATKPPERTESRKEPWNALKEISESRSNTTDRPTRKAPKRGGGIRRQRPDAAATRLGRRASEPADRHPDRHHIAKRGRIGDLAICAVQHNVKVLIFFFFWRHRQIATSHSLAT